ncbi:Ankyrin [Pleurostoma richardsiae]|uniref:Ankyrin n=1 Tax=Pleurostoma richardsiae TaxID=41990 RepID=A0AA38VK86_9PEZI|nr:Ankyrin [Pleurostoma richardsiae]
MRLLDTSTLRLVNKHEGDIPAYAILSHTWGGDDEEVTFQDIQEASTRRFGQLSALFGHHAALQKAGFAKIRDSARLAESQGYQFIWIDTCCIDKTSSAELSEAINSMFRWYREAAVCYAFLDDVDDGLQNPFRAPAKEANAAGAGVDHEERDLVQSIRSSRWFTRGWTLQELIAPSNVYFYSRSWNLLGSRLGDDMSGPLSPVARFPELLSEITGIDSDVLAGFVVLEDLSVANRMKWAARRQTTRPEDIAYCLMGIFNVNMPLLYGEGHRAFMRLQEEILKVTDDQSIFAWRCPENDMLRYQLVGLLAPKPAYFEDFGDIEPLPPDPSRSSAPSTTTNAGLHVQLYLKKRDGLQRLRAPLHEQEDNESRDEYYAILQCSPQMISEDTGMFYHRLAIRLIALGGDQHARLNPERVFWIRSDQASITDEEGGNRYIYVKQLPAYGLPDIMVHRGDSSGDVDAPSSSLIAVYPRWRWNPQTRTLKPETSSHNSILGIFRYDMRSRSSPGAFLVDIFVGLFPAQQGLVSWRCWCFQQPILPDSTTGPDPLTFNPRIGVRFSDRHAHQGIVASVRTVRLHNRTYVSLEVAELHELVGTEESVESTPEIHELDAEEGNSTVASLAVIAGNPIIEDTWQLSLGLSDGTASEPNPPRVRTSPRRNTGGGHEAPDREPFRQVLERAARSDLAIENAGITEADMFERYFSVLLVRACARNDTSAATILVDSPLSTALVEVKTFIKAEKVEPWHKIFDGFRPLHWASALGHVETVRLLIDHGADPTSITNSGLSTVHLATMSGRPEVLNHLLDVTSHLWPWWYSTHHRAEKPALLAASYVLSDDAEAILSRLMFDDQAPDERENSLHEMSENEAKDETSENGAEDELGSDAKYEAYTALEEGAPGLALNKLRETPLHRAAAMNNINAARCILSRAADSLLSSRDSFGRTPLWHAAAAGAVEIVNLLLDHRADPDTPDQVGRTPLHVACRMGYGEVVEELLRAGAKVDAVTHDPGLTACHFAALGDHADVLQILLQHGADADRCEGLGASKVTLAPLHIAAANGFLECVRVLVEAGCDTEAKSNHRILVSSAHPTGVFVSRFIDLRPVELAILGSHNIVARYLDTPESLSISLF